MENVKSVVKRVWGYDALLPLQEEAIGAVLARRDSVVILPTGGGKSLCYQAPAAAMGKLAVVVSPLISLMKDQVDGLRVDGVAASFLNSTLLPHQRDEVIASVRDGRCRLLYVSPERLVGDGGPSRPLRRRPSGSAESCCKANWCAWPPRRASPSTRPKRSSIASGRPMPSWQRRATWIWSTWAGPSCRTSTPARSTMRSG